jgi:hypothetical protein
MTVKIDGTNGIDTAQIRAPDGDPVAMTVGNDGKVAFPAMGTYLPTNEENGFITLPGGLIIQWGRYVQASGNESIAFPVPFPTKVASMQVTGSHGSLLAAGEMVSASFNSLNLSGCQISARFDSSGTGIVPSGWSVNWMAIGY